MKKNSNNKNAQMVGGRRRFLGGVTALAAYPFRSVAANTTSRVELTTKTDSAEARPERAWRIRTMAADRHLQQPVPLQQSNGDEDRYLARIGNFGKTLPHNALGEVDRTAYQKYLDALRSGDPQDFNLIPMGGQGRLTSPQSGLAFEMVGNDA